MTTRLVNCGIFGAIPSKNNALSRPLHMLKVLTSDSWVIIQATHLNMHDMYAAVMPDNHYVQLVLSYELSTYATIYNCSGMKASSIGYF